MQTPAFSARSERLDDLYEDLRTRVHIAQLRLRNAERGLCDATNSNTCSPCSTQAMEAYRAERDLARQALRELREQQSRCLTARERHTGEPPNGSLVIVLDGRTGEQYVIERSDGDNPPEFGTWYRLGSDDPMTFDTAIGIDEGYSGHEFFRLYSTEQVDDLLDRAGVDDLFI